MASGAPRPPAGPRFIFAAPPTLFRRDRERRLAQRRDDRAKFRFHPLQAQQPQDEPEFAQHVERQPVAVAERACDLKRPAGNR